MGISTYLILGCAAALLVGVTIFITKKVILRPHNRVRIATDELGTLAIHLINEAAILDRVDPDNETELQCSQLTENAVTLDKAALILMRHHVVKHQKND